MFFVLNHCYFLKGRRLHFRDILLIECIREHFVYTDVETMI